MNDDAVEIEAINLLKNLKRVSKWRGENKSSSTHYRHAAAVEITGSGKTFIDAGRNTIRIINDESKPLHILQESLSSFLTIDHLYAVDVTI